MRKLVVIPARYASTRLPGKPLAKIGDRTMIEWVFRRAQKANVDEVVVATDDQRIVSSVEAFGGKALITSSAHQSGTDRIYEAAQRLNCSDDDILINVQGDEPFIPSTIINQVAELIEKRRSPMSTLKTPIHNVDDISNPNVVKVVSNVRQQALYFSRSGIPFVRDEEINRSHLNIFARHIGIYAYRFDFLREFTALSISQLEATEKLEQLRALENGYNIAIEDALTVPQLGIDTSDDLEKANQLVASGQYD